MIYLIIFLSCIGAATTAAYFMKNRFEQALPFTLLSVIAVTYIFGLLGILYVGFITIAAVVVFSLGFFVWLTVRDRAFLLSNILTPGFVMFTVFFVYFCAFYVNSVYVTHGDDFTHWAYIVKQMNVYDVLHSSPDIIANFPGFPYQLSPEKMQDFRSYPPAQSIFLWLFQKANGGVFDEHLLYSARNLLGFSLLLPLSYKLSFKKPLNALLVFLIIIFFPLSFFLFSHYSTYNILMIDHIISFFFCYVLITFFDKEEKDKRLLINLAVALFVGSLIKSSTIFFMLSAAIIITIILLRDNGKNKQNLIFSGTLFLAPLAAIGSWWLSLKVNSFGTPSISNNVDMKQWLTTGEPAYVSKIPEIFLKSQYLPNVFHINDSINPPLLVIIAAALAVLGLFCFLGVTSKTETKVLIPAFAIMYIVYQISLLCSYMFYFTEAESIMLSSFERYCGTIIMAFFLILLYFVIRVSRTEPDELPPKLRKFTPFFVQSFVLSAITIVILMFVPVSRLYSMLPEIDPLRYDIMMSELKDGIFQTIKEDGKENPEAANVALLFTSTKGAYCLFNFYMYPLTPQNYSYLNITTEPTDENSDKLFVKPSDYIDFLLKNNIEYVYTMNVTDENRAEYSSIFTEPIQGEILYKLENGKLRPLKVIT